MYKEELFNSSSMMDIGYQVADNPDLNSRKGKSGKKYLSNLFCTKLKQQQIETLPTHLMPITMSREFQKRVMINLEKRLLKELEEFESEGGLELCRACELKQYIEELSRKYSQVQLDITNYLSDSFLEKVGYKRNPIEEILH